MDPVLDLQVPRQKCRRSDIRQRHLKHCEWVLPVSAPAAKPGDDLLFHSLSWSTIGAVRFHGRVRDGIGWVTDAMATKLWGQRMQGFFDAKAEVPPHQDIRCCR